MVTRLRGAVLEIDASLDGQSVTGVFELRKGFEEVGEGQRQFVFGPSGETAARTLGILDEDNVDGNRRSFAIDGGGGRSHHELTAELSETEYGDYGYLQMGDTGDETTLTARDATGAGPGTQSDMLYRYAEQATTDSLNPARLHIGHWHDGTYSSDGEAGLFGDPRSVFITEWRRMTEKDRPSSKDVKLTCVLAGALFTSIAASELEGY